MKVSLGKWLTSKGVEKEEDLTPEEKVVFDRYKLILSGEAVSLESLKTFCQAQIRLIETACDGKNPLTMIQQAALHVYINILKAIEAPEAERASLERMLVQELQ